jgi:hypothetical protein
MRLNFTTGYQTLPRPQKIGGLLTGLEFFRILPLNEKMKYGTVHILRQQLEGGRGFENADGC